MNNEARHINDNRFIGDDPGRPDDIIYYKAWIERCKKQSLSMEANTPQSPEFNGQEWEIVDKKRNKNGTDTS